MRALLFYAQSKATHPEALPLEGGGGRAPPWGGEGGGITRPKARSSALPLAAVPAASPKTPSEAATEGGEPLSMVKYKSAIYLI